MNELMELWPGGFSLRTDKRQFKPGIDSVLLSSFPSLSGVRTVCDLGGGIGTLSLSLLARKRSLAVSSVEINSAACELARENIERNGLSASVELLCGDLRDIRRLLPAASFDLVICNPPYFKSGSGLLPSSPDISGARHDDCCTLAEVCSAAAWLLPTGGAFSLVYRFERLVDLLYQLRCHGLEPKRLLPVYFSALKAPDLVLLSAKAGAKPGLKAEPPLILYDGQGNETAEYKALNLYRNYKKLVDGGGL